MMKMKFLIQTVRLKKFLTDQLLELLVDESNKYAVRKNIVNLMSLN